MRSRGEASYEGACATLTFRRTYRHAIEHVWDAISTPEGLRGWLMCTHAQIEGRAGGRIEMVAGPPAYRSMGVILVWDPPHVLEYEWNVRPVPEMPRGQQAIIRYELTADGDATHVLVTYRNITKETATGFLPGVHVFLDRLEAQLDGSHLPDWMARFQEVSPEYPDWKGHAPAPGQ